MKSTLADPRLEPPQIELIPEAGGRFDDEVRMQVWGLLTQLYPKRQWAERRREHRYPYPCLIHLTPLAADGVTPAGDSIVVAGKHLSERGIGFYHADPLPHRRMIVSLEALDGTWIGFLVDLTWCRFTRHRWYESGGKFLGSVLSPLADEEE